MTFRECGDCTACCKGFLLGNAYGNTFGYGKQCVFLVNNRCSIYKDRPSVCQKFQCAWTQHLFPDWMKPNECGVIISVEYEVNTTNPVLRVIEMRETIDYAIYAEIEKFCKDNNTYYVKVPYESRHA